MLRSPNLLVSANLRPTAIHHWTGKIFARKLMSCPNWTVTLCLTVLRQGQHQVINITKITLLGQA